MIDMIDPVLPPEPVTGPPTDTEEPAPMVPGSGKKPLDEMSKEELLAEAALRGVQVKTNANKPEIRAAIIAADVDAPIPGVSVSPMTLEQLEVLRSSPDEDIQAVLNKGYDGQYRSVFENELAHRAKARQAVADLKARQSEIQRFKVMNGKMFYGREFQTTLATGSIVTEHTHDLAELKRQGFILEPAGVPRTVYDELGVQKTAF